MNLGNTPAGQAWALKALHPSDPITDVLGVPDRTAAASTVICFQQTTELRAPGTATTWEGEAYMMADPVIFGSAYTRLSDNTVSANGPIFNNTWYDPLAAADAVSAAVAKFSASFERYRMTHYGVTVYLDAPALSNQGSIVAAQYQAAPLSLSNPTYVDSVCAHPAIRWQQRDTPDFTTCMQLPNAYTGLAKDGCYMPLKMDSNHAVWRDVREVVYEATDWARRDTGVVDELTTTYVVPGTAGSLGAGLYPGLKRLYYASASNAWVGQFHMLPAIENTGVIAWKGLDPKATLRFVHRVGFECQCQPGTSFAPFLRMAPGHDEAAVDSYFAIARELKDAYPAEYNDFGKLWDVIKGAAKRVSPLIETLLPGPAGAAVRTIGGLIGRGGDLLASGRRRNPKKENLIPATVIQEQKDLQRVASTKPATAARAKQTLRIQRRPARL